MFPSVCWIERHVPSTPVPPVLKTEDNAYANILRWSVFNTKVSAVNADGPKWNSVYEWDSLVNIHRCWHGNGRYFCLVGNSTSCKFFFKKNRKRKYFNVQFYKTVQNLKNQNICYCLWTLFKQNNLEQMRWTFFLCFCLSPSFIFLSLSLSAASVAGN